MDFNTFVWYFCLLLLLSATVTPSHDAVTLFSSLRGLTPFVGQSAAGLPTVKAVLTPRHLERLLGIDEELPATGRTQQQILDRLTSQMPKLFVDELPFEVFTEDVIYRNPYGEVNGKGDFKRTMAQLRKLYTITLSSGDVNYSNARFTDALTAEVNCLGLLPNRFSQTLLLQMDWTTTVCSSLLKGLCSEISGNNVDKMTPELYSYLHIVNFETPWPRLFFRNQLTY
eukprot:GHVS01107429.1.p1 GENE.GHVS01107429.1~~GHVS01107429.1.p1  ORF type:complete len:227 (+),score=15.02 GHVS01107429.1:65-745(+)